MSLLPYVLWEDADHCMVRAIRRELIPGLKVESRGQLTEDGEEGEEGTLLTLGDYDIDLDYDVWDAEDGIEPAVNITIYPLHRRGSTKAVAVVQMPGIDSAVWFLSRWGWDRRLREEVMAAYCGDGDVYEPIYRHVKKSSVTRRRGRKPR